MMRSNYAIDQMYGRLVKRAAMSGGEAFARGVGDLFEFLPRRRRHRIRRPKIKPEGVAMGEDFRAVMDDFRQSFSA